jgi:hypothetical protein
MRSRSADFQDVFKQLACNHGYTKQEMLVLIKAYELYNSDVSLGKLKKDSGWVDPSYDIAPGIFHSPLLTIAITDLRDKKPEFWEYNDKDGRLRLSEVGRTYIEENVNLLKSAKGLLGGVSHVRRC